MDEFIARHVQRVHTIFLTSYAYFSTTFLTLVQDGHEIFAHI